MLSLPPFRALSNSLPASEANSSSQSTPQHFLVSTAGKDTKLAIPFQWTIRGSAEVPMKHIVTPTHFDLLLPHTGTKGSLYFLDIIILNYTNIVLCFNLVWLLWWKLPMKISKATIWTPKRMYVFLKMRFPQCELFVIEIYMYVNTVHSCWLKYKFLFAYFLFSLQIQI